MKKQQLTTLAYQIYQDADCVWQTLRRNEYEYDKDMIYQNLETARRYAIRAQRYFSDLLEDLEKHIAENMEE